MLANTKSSKRQKDQSPHHIFTDYQSNSIRVKSEVCPHAFLHNRYIVKITLNDIIYTPRLSQFYSLHDAENIHDALVQVLKENYSALQFPDPRQAYRKEATNRLNFSKELPTIYPVHFNIALEIYNHSNALAIITGYCNKELLEPLNPISTPTTPPLTFFNSVATANIIRDLYPEAYSTLWEIKEDFDTPKPRY